MANRKSEHRLLRQFKPFKLIYRQKSRKIKIIVGNKNLYKKTDYYILLSNGGIYNVPYPTTNIKNKKNKKIITTFPVASYHGNIKNPSNCKGIRIQKFIIEALEYINKKGIKIQ